MNSVCLAEKLYKSLGPELCRILETISDCAHKYGYKVYIIGGVVRDLLLDKPVYDIDIVTEGSAIDFCRLGEQDKIWKITRICEEFGTAKTAFPNGVEVDFASTRLETYPKAGHLPLVEKTGCKLKEDILRRDFTVNALALSLNKEDFGCVLDYTTGLKEIKTKELKILHNKSFIDDPTRIIRALRFQYKLNFRLEKETGRLRDEYLKSFDNNDICYERIKHVVKLAFNLNSPQLFDEFISSGIYKLIGNPVRKCTGKGIFNTILKYEKEINKQNIWLIWLACLINSHQAEKFNFTGKEAKIINSVETLLQTEIPTADNYEICNIFNPHPAESVISYIALTNSPQAEKYLTKLKNIKPFLTGKNLAKLGYKEGKITGAALDKIFREKVNGNIVTKEDEINLAKILLKQLK